MIYYLMSDSWSMLIVPAGEVPLILMWGLNISHLIGLFCFVVCSFSDCARKKFVLPKPDVVEQAKQTWKLMISIILIQVS